MKKHVLLRTNLAIVCIIVAGCLGMLWLNFHSFNEIVEDDIENITKLTSSTIYAEIGNSLSKPIFVSLTMANDTFLKSWVAKEKDHRGDPAYRRQLHDYLNALKDKYQYNSVFLISAASNLYYHFDGVHKKVSPENAHDVWYYRFVDSGLPYKLNVDQDEADRHVLTVFVDCRLEDAEGRLLGVVGVGVRMSHLQALLKGYEDGFNLRAYLINPEGIVQVHTDSGLIRRADIFADPAVAGFRQRLLGSKDAMEMFWYPQGSLENCMISRYIETLGWYLVVEKNTRVIRDSLLSLIQQDAAIVAVILAVLLALVSCLIQRCNRLALAMATTDALTGLPNRQSFNARFGRRMGRRGAGGGSGEESVLFMFDIDDFKGINDRRGHLAGNAVLAGIAEKARELVGGRGMLARWGGDEFVGMLWGTFPEMAGRLETLVAELGRFETHGERLSVSMGATRVGKERPETENGFDALLKEADAALYLSKARGKNRLTFFDGAQ